MEIGYLLHTRQIVNRQEADLSFQRLWSDAEQAEALGFDHVWIGDSVTVLDKARGDCLTTMAGLAAHTRKVRIGTVPMLAALRQPVTLAHSLATLDVMSSGRILVAVSVGPNRDYIQRQFAACGVPPAEKAGRLSETIQIMRRLWTEPRISFKGRYYDFDDVGILPHPVDPKGIPIWVVADRNETGFRRVARHGDGWVTLNSKPEGFADARRRIDGYAREYGREGRIAESAVYATFNIQDDGDEARRQGWNWMEKFFEQPREKLAYHFTIFGSPKDCVQTLRKYRQAGMTTIIARIAADDMAAQSRRLLNEVKPQLAV